MKKRRKNKRIIPVFVIILFVVAIAVIGLHKTGIYRFDFFKDVYKKIDFQLNTNELNIPQDALSFSMILSKANTYFTRVIVNSLQSQV